VRADWKKPRRFDCNLIVIGAGSAGLVSSYIAAIAKAKVTLVEAHEMGLARQPERLQLSAKWWFDRMCG
jgi:glycine/D-amino acid oxidase-like deaminating enzyme